MAGVRQPFTIELGLLGLLHAQPMHPYELHQRLTTHAALSSVWYVKQAHLYALLHRLEAAGLVTSSTEPQGSRPPRRVLSLTPAGAAAFAHWRTEPVVHGREFRLELLAKLYFAQAEGPGAVQTLVDGQRRACQERLQHFERELAMLDPEQAYQRLVLEFRCGQLAASLAWLDRCATLLLGL